MRGRVMENKGKNESVSERTPQVYAARKQGVAGDAVSLLDTHACHPNVITCKQKNKPEDANI